MAKDQPTQPPQPSQAKAKAKRQRLRQRSRGRKGKQAVRPPQPSLAEAQAEAKANQPPQPPLGNASKPTNDASKQDKQKVKPRRRGGRKRRNSTLSRGNSTLSRANSPRTAPSLYTAPSIYVPSHTASVYEPSHIGEECRQTEVYTRSKRLRVDSPPVASQNVEIASQVANQDDAGSVEKAPEKEAPATERGLPVRSIKPTAIPLRRSYTPHFPKAAFFTFSHSKSKPPKPSTKPSISSHLAAQRLQRSKTYRANLKAKRDFPHTLEALSQVSNSDTDSEYTPISRADSIPTSGQSTPEAAPEPISNEDLFGLRAKPCSPVPSTPSTWSLSSSSSSRSSSSSETDDVS